MSGIYDCPLLAGGVQNLSVAGNYVKIRTAPFGLVQVKIDGGESYLLDEGLGLRLPPGKFFRDVQITNKSPSPQTILVFIGDSSFEDTRVTGFVSVTNKIGANSTILEPFNGVFLPVGFLATPVVLPANNPRGLLVRRAATYCTSGAGGTAEIRLVASPTVPTQMLTANSFQLSGTNSTGGVQGLDNHNDQNYQLPATWGVYALTGHAVSAAASAGLSLTYEPL